VRARELARSIVDVATGAGLKTRALLTDMDSPLGATAGNALEVREAVDFLAGRHETRLYDCTKALAVDMLDLSGLAEREAAGPKLDAALASGAAAERFARMVAALGGPKDFVERADIYLPRAPIVRAVAAPRRGFAYAIATRSVGIAVLELGGGRTDPAASIDHAVGFAEIAPLGAEVGPGRPLAVMHARDEASAERAARTLASAYDISDAPPAASPVVRETLGA
jgi:thymidine phosphorylase